MRRLPPLSALRAFEAAARNGSFKRAADELAVTPTAISHQIRSLEKHTGLTLFERKVRKVVLSEAGEQLYPVLQQGFDAFEAVLRRLSQPTGRTRVTISATSAFTARWLLPRVAGVRELYPDIDLQLQASDEVVDLDACGVDIAIRYGRGPYPGLVAKPMFADEFAPLANPGLGISDPTELSRFPLIHFQWRRKQSANPNWQKWFAKAGLPGPSDPGQLQYSDEGHAIQATIAGQGVALLSLALAADELSAGRLVQPFGPTLEGYTYHLVMSEAREPRNSVSSVADWIMSEVGSMRTGDSGSAL